MGFNWKNRLEGRRGDRNPLLLGILTKGSFRFSSYLQIFSCAVPLAVSTTLTHSNVCHFDTWRLERQGVPTTYRVLSCETTTMSVPNHWWPPLLPAAIGIAKSNELWIAANHSLHSFTFFRSWWFFFCVLPGAGQRFSQQSVCITAIDVTPNWNGLITTWTCRRKLLAVKIQFLLLPPPPSASPGYSSN